MTYTPAAPWLVAPAPTVPLVGPTEVWSSIQYTSTTLTDQTYVGYHSVNLSIVPKLFPTNTPSSFDFDVEILDCVPTVDPPPQIADVTYTIYSDSYMELPVPAFGFSPPECIWWNYELSWYEIKQNGDLGTLDDWIKYHPDNGTVSLFQVDLMEFANTTWTIGYQATMDDYVESQDPSVLPGDIVFSDGTLSDFMTFEVNFLDNCSAAKFVPVEFDPIELTVFDPDIEWEFDEFTDDVSSLWSAYGSQRIINCGPITYEVKREVDGVLTDPWINGISSNVLLFQPDLDN